MERTGKDTIAVIFVSRRTPGDDLAYAAAAQAMEEEAARQPGFLGIESVRDASGRGITVSYWSDEAAVVAWRDHAEHSAIRNRGRADWYERYELVVARVVRSYDWKKGAGLATSP